jgi:predicted RNA-binding protein (virulence factor B family)
MLEFGHMNRLEVRKIDNDGAWLQAGQEKVLLPKREVTAEISAGDRLDVFVYADASGSPVATLRQPFAEAGEFALMRVNQITVHGAFMDWGLTKDLLVPIKEQLEKMHAGGYYIVKVRLDHEGRPIGSARINKNLTEVDNTLEVGQEVDLLVWQFTELGAKVIIDHRFNGLLYNDEIGDRLKYGDRLKGYVRQIRSDGKIDCTLSMGTKDDRDDARAKLMRALIDHEGLLPLHDKSPPEVIQETLGVSKKIFKKAVGGLYKSGLVELTEDGLRLKEKS